MQDRRYSCESHDTLESQESESYMDSDFCFPKIPGWENWQEVDRRDYTSYDETPTKEPITMAKTIKFKHISATCILVVWGDGKASLGDVYSADKGKGHATQMLNEVIRYADEKKLTIVSAAEPYGEEPRLNLPQLIRFYEKFGFVFMDNNPISPYMERAPK